MKAKFLILSRDIYLKNLYIKVNYFFIQSKAVLGNRYLVKKIWIIEKNDFIGMREGSMTIAKDN